jgi:2Fe-2S ferredoxin
MTLVRVDPNGIVLDVRADESLIEAAWRLGYEWPTTCYGQAECTTCAFELIDGADHASPVGPDEAAALGALGAGRRALRLACRVRFHGDAVVRKRGVRPTRLEDRP